MNGSSTQTRLLIIDDDNLIHKIVAKSLDDSFEIISAKNAKEGIKLTLREQPDIILLDVEMPGLNGYECCEILKRGDDTKAIPVVFLSANTGLRERMLGYEAGADDYLVKPFEASELQAKLSVKAQRKHHRDKLKVDVEQAEHTALEAITGSSELGCVMRYVELTYGIRNLDTLAFQLLELVKSFGLKSTVLLDSLTGVEYFSSNGDVKPLEKELLLSCRENNRFIDFGCRTIINYPKVSLLIKNMPLDDAERYGRYKDMLPTVLGATDAKIRMIESNDAINMQATQTQDSLSKIQMSLASLACQLAENQTQAFSTMNELSQTMHAQLPRLGLEEDQEVFILKNIDDTLDLAQDKLDSATQLNETLNAIVDTSAHLSESLAKTVESAKVDIMYMQGETYEQDDDDYQMDVELF